MTRIISGFAGSRELKVPKTGTRPTSDRVREAIFSTLEARGEIDGARVLDLYAGTGSLGLEALSRGAATVTLVENYAAAVQALQVNAQLVRSAGAREPSAAMVVPSKVQSFLNQSGPRARSYTLVFIDPPYELDNAELLSTLTSLVPLVADDAVIVVERSSRTPEFEVPEGIEFESRRSYGDTTVYLLVTQSANR